MLQGSFGLFPACAAVRLPAAFCIPEPGIQTKAGGGGLAAVAAVEASDGSSDTRGDGSSDDTRGDALVSAVRFAGRVMHPDGLEHTDLETREDALDRLNLKRQKSNSEAEYHSGPYATIGNALAAALTSSSGEKDTRGTRTSAVRAPRLPPGGLIAHPVGAGKTVICAAFLAREKRHETSPVRVHDREVEIGATPPGVRVDLLDETGELLECGVHPRVDLQLVLRRLASHVLGHVVVALLVAEYSQEKGTGFLPVDCELGHLRLLCLLHLGAHVPGHRRSEEHTSELQSP